MQDHIDLRLMRDPGSIILEPVVEGRAAYFFAKRVLDILLAGSLLLLALPVMALIGAIIYIYSPGPIFFKQERVGAKRVRHGNAYFWKMENFTLYKFRTMKVDGDPAQHKAYVQALILNDRQKIKEIQGQKTEVRKLLNDPRIIPPGKLLRKSSLDELPQLWNVLCGDMSMVGPRPALPYEVEVYKPWHMLRLEAQPGISGLQQVTARCSADFDEQVTFDLEYINNQSIWLDLKIALKTPLMILSTKGAG